MLKKCTPGIIIEIEVILTIYYPSINHVRVTEHDLPDSGLNSFCSGLWNNTMFNHLFKYLDRQINGCKITRVYKLQETLYLIPRRFAYTNISSIELLSEYK